MPSKQAILKKWANITVGNLIIYGIPLQVVISILYILVLNFRNDFKDYSLQSRLHFRIHSAQSDLKKQLKGKKSEGAQTRGSIVDDCNEALEVLDLDKDCEFLDAEDGEFKEPEQLDPNLTFKTAITEEDARKIIEGKQLK